MIAIGIGCRSGASKDAILTLIAEARARAAITDCPAQLFTYEGKKDEAGLVAAAAALDLPLVFLSRESLQAVAAKIATRSQAAERALGIPSVAEAAALAGCGAEGRLLLSRITGEGATCAIAERIEQ